MKIFANVIPSGDMDETRTERKTDQPLRVESSLEQDARDRVKRFMLLCDDDHVPLIKIEIALSLFRRDFNLEVYRGLLTGESATDANRKAFESLEQLHQEAEKQYQKRVRREIDRLHPQHNGSRMSEKAALTEVDLTKFLAAIEQDVLVTSLRVFIRAVTKKLGWDANNSLNLDQSEPFSDIAHDLNLLDQLSADLSQNMDLLNNEQFLSRRLTMLNDERIKSVARAVLTRQKNNHFRSE